MLTRCGLGQKGLPAERVEPGRLFASEGWLSGVNDPAAPRIVAGPVVKATLAGSIETQRCLLLCKKTWALGSWWLAWGFSGNEAGGVSS